MAACILLRPPPGPLLRLGAQVIREFYRKLSPFGLRLRAVAAPYGVVGLRKAGPPEVLLSADRIEIKHRLAQIITCHSLRVKANGFQMRRSVSAQRFQLTREARVALDSHIASVLWTHAPL